MHWRTTDSCLGAKREGGFIVGTRDFGLRQLNLGWKIHHRALPHANGNQFPFVFLSQLLQMPAVCIVKKKKLRISHLHLPIASLLLSQISLDVENVGLKSFFKVSKGADMRVNGREDAWQNERGNWEAYQQTHSDQTYEAVSIFLLSKVELWKIFWPSKFKLIWFVGRIAVGFFGLSLLLVVIWM